MVLIQRRQWSAYCIDKRGTDRLDLTPRIGTKSEGIAQWPWPKGAHHSLGLGVIRPSEVRRVLLLEPDPAPERVLCIILKNATCRVVDEQQAVLLAHIRKRQSAHHIRPDRLHLVCLAPVHIRPPRHPCRVEHMRRFNRLHIGLQARPILQPPRSVLVRNPLLLTQLPQKPSQPSGAPVDQELQTGIRHLRHLPILSIRCHLVAMAVHFHRCRTEVLAQCRTLLQTATKPTPLTTNVRCGAPKHPGLKNSRKDTKIALVNALPHAQLPDPSNHRKLEDASVYTNRLTKTHTHTARALHHKRISRPSELHWASPAPVRTKTKNVALQQNRDTNKSNPSLPLPSSCRLQQTKAWSAKNGGKSKSSRILTLRSYTKQLALADGNGDEEMCEAGRAAMVVVVVVAMEGLCMDCGYGDALYVRVGASWCGRGVLPTGGEMLWEEWQGRPGVDAGCAFAASVLALVGTVPEAGTPGFAAFTVVACAASGRSRRSHHSPRETVVRCFALQFQFLVLAECLEHIKLLHIFTVEKRHLELPTGNLSCAAAFYGRWLAYSQSICHIVGQKEYLLKKSSPKN